MEEDKRRGLDLWAGKIPWRRKWETTPVFLAGESHGQRSLAGYSPWGHKERDMTEQLTHTHCILSIDNKYKICQGKTKVSMS